MSIVDNKSAHQHRKRYNGNHSSWHNFSAIVESESVIEGHERQLSRIFICISKVYLPVAHQAAESERCAELQEWTWRIIGVEISADAEKGSEC